MITAVVLFINICRNYKKHTLLLSCQTAATVMYVGHKTSPVDIFQRTALFSG